MSFERIFPTWFCQNKERTQNWIRAGIIFLQVFFIAIESQLFSLHPVRQSVKFVDFATELCVWKKFFKAASTSYALPSQSACRVSSKFEYWILQNNFEKNNFVRTIFRELVTMLRQKQLTLKRFRSQMIFSWTKYFLEVWV